MMILFRLLRVFVPNFARNSRIEGGVHDSDLCFYYSDAIPYRPSIVLVPCHLYA